MPARRFPPALVDRGNPRLLHRAGPRWASAGVCVYYEDEPGRRSAAKRLTKDKARAHCGEYR